MLHGLLIWAVLTAILPPPASLRCIKVNESQCRDVEFAPGIDLAGEGFDITTMERKGAYVLDMSTWVQNDKSCTLCSNPFMGGKKQKIPVSVLGWRASQKCRMKVSSSTYQSSESLVSSVSSSIENNWKISLGISKLTTRGSLMLAGSNSKLAAYSMGKTKNDKFIFTTHGVSCGYYSYRVVNRPPVRTELKTEFEHLPQRYDEHTKYLYYKLIDTFGTHYLSKVTMGGAIHSVTSIKDCEVTMQGMSADEVKACLDVEASFSTMGKVDVDIASAYQHCKNKKAQSMNQMSFSGKFNDRDTDVIGGHTQNIDLLFSSKTDPKAYNEWLKSLPDHPDVLSYSLESIHKLIPPKNPSHEHLRNAIKDYVLQRGLLKDCTGTCKAGIKTNPQEPCICSCHNSPGVAPNCCPTKRGFAQVTVTAVRATGLYGDYFGQTDGYVKLISGGRYFGQTRIIEGNNSPRWDYTFNLGTHDLISFNSVTLEVWDEDNGYDDDLLGTCVVKLKSGVEQNMCALNHGILYYKVSVTCAHSLSGPSCFQYLPSPMESQLEKVYTSRHARPIPRDMLLKMGVLLDERIPRFNQSNNRNAKGFEL